MNRRVEKYFPVIMEIMINDIFKDEISGDGIPKECKGYISTFGAMIIQNGLIPALAFFEKKDDGAKKDKKGVPYRQKIVDVVKKILKFQIKEDGKLCQYLAEKIQSKKMTKDELRAIENKVIDISIAIKLALRTFLEEK